MINTDGTIREAEVMKGIGPGADEEALRVVKESPEWTPAYQKGKAVASLMTLPINFKLGSVIDMDFAPRTRQIN